MAREQSRETTASPERVWSIWSNVDTWPQWNPDVKAISLEGPFQSETKGTMTTTRGTRSIKLEDVQPGRSFMVATWPAPATRMRFHCEVTPSGSGSRISQSVTMFGWLGPLMWIFMGGSIAKSFGPILDGLAKAAEEPASV